MGIQHTTHNCSFEDDDDEEDRDDVAGAGGKGASETNSSVLAGLMDKKASGEILTVVPPDDGAMRQGVPIIVDLAFVSFIFWPGETCISINLLAFPVSGIQRQVPRRSRTARGKC